MNANEKRFGGVMLKVGAAMLIFSALFTFISFVYTILSLSLPMLFDQRSTNIISELSLGIMYFSSFMIPAIVLCLMCGKGTMTKALTPKVPVNAAVYVFAGIALITAMAYLNSILLSALGIPQTGGSSSEGLENYQFVLMFITTAVVPAICEEFLFRGAIMHSLLRFGKAPAIMISAVLFGLMHMNASQFLYATAAGILLGWIACETGSIYCGILVHFVQNFTAVLQSVLFDRLQDPQLTVVYYAFELLLFAVGIPCTVYLVIKHFDRAKSNNGASSGIFGRSDSNDNGSLELRHSTAVKLFFSPTVIIFIVISALNAAIRFVEL